MSGPQVVSSTPDETTTTMGAAPTKTSEWWGIKAFPTADVAEYGLGKQSGGSVSGYFLKKELIAVLSLPSFQEDGDNIGNFSKAVTKFIAASKKAGSKKVVIDLQQNYGGDALLAYDTFKQFFPTIDPYGGSQMRATPPTRAMGESITNYWNGLNDTDDLWSYFYADEWMASNKLDAATDKKFTSWDQFHGPVMKNGDGHTKIASTINKPQYIVLLTHLSKDTTSLIRYLIPWHWGHTKKITRFTVMEVRRRKIPPLTKRKT